jgi:predicted aspartyl protease
MLVLPAMIHADGRYRIILDDDGLFFETENEGGWYIPEEDQNYFQPGQTGRYLISRDSNGHFLETEHGKFYLSFHSDEEPDTEIEAFNRLQNKPTPTNTESEVIVAGQHVIVPVQIQHGGRSLNLKLLLDTGASIITLHKSAIKRLQLHYSRKAHFTTASGHTIAADIVKLKEFRFGPYRKYNILAGVIDYRQNGSVDYDGLLGMNALQGLNYSIDYKNSVLKWNNE